LHPSIQSIAGQSWPGIEHGAPPSYPLSFAQYCAFAEQGDIAAFVRHSATNCPWWTPTVDRGAGALLHIAVDHGQLAFVQWLVDKQMVLINQQDRSLGWTPLHRCARMAHSRSRPWLEVFEFLLSRGGDADILTYEGWEDGAAGKIGWPQSVFDVCADVGVGWQPGRLRRTLRALVDKHRAVPKQPVYRYEGPPIAPAGFAMMAAWAALPESAFGFGPPPSDEPGRIVTQAQLRDRDAAARAVAACTF